MKRYRDSTKIWLALDKQSRIEGMMLLYGKNTVQLRGNAEAARALLDEIDLEEVDIQGPTEHKALISGKFGNIKKASEIILMTLREGEENLQIRHRTVRLSIEDAEDVAALVRRGSSDWWGGASAEGVARRFGELLWLGAKAGGELVSVGGATIDDWESSIAPVVTHENFRNRGYTTSVASALVKEILRRSELALIHVESDNQPAMRVYARVGFKPYRRYLLVRAGK